MRVDDFWSARRARVAEEEKSLADMELAEAVAAVYRAYTTSSWYTHGMVCSSGPCGLVSGSSVPGV